MCCQRRRCTPLLPPPVTHVLCGSSTMDSVLPVTSMYPPPPSPGHSHALWLLHHGQCVASDVDVPPFYPPGHSRALWLLHHVQCVASDVNVPPPHPLVTHMLCGSSTMDSVLPVTSMYPPPPSPGHSHALWLLYHGQRVASDVNVPPPPSPGHSHALWLLYHGQRVASDVNVPPPPIPRSLTCSVAPLPWTACCQ